MASVKISDKTGVARIEIRRMRRTPFVAKRRGRRMIRIRRSRKQIDNNSLIGSRYGGDNKKREIVMLNVNRFATHLRRCAVCGFGKGQCARFVRMALEEGGADTTGHPVNARDWGPLLLLIGFQPVEIADIDAFAPATGDVAVI